MNYYLYTHIGSGNRGCEATARSLQKMLNLEKKDMYIFSEDYEEEMECGTEKYATVIYTPEINKLRPFSSILPRCLTKFGVDRLASVKYRYKKMFRTVENADIGLSTGGDIFCYDKELANKIGYLTQRMKNKGGTTCLIACSIDKKNLTRETLEILQKFDYIFPRESLTENNLKERGVNNVITYPDPAFVLPVSPIKELSNLEKKDYIGLNYSSYVNAGYFSSANYRTMVTFISEQLKKTEMDIILIPHVYWNDENDLILLKKIKSEFANEDRVILIENKYNCMQLKYIISRCRFFIGARTHSVIGAYSSGVPTLALGYSIKSKGIATDIFGTYENFVFDSERLNDYDAFSRAFQGIVEREEEIKHVLYERNKVFEKCLSEQATFLHNLKG